MSRKWSSPVYVFFKKTSIKAVVIVMYLNVLPVDVKAVMGVLSLDFLTKVMLT